TSMPTTSSITELESTSSAIRRASATTSSLTSPSTVSAKRLPMRTSVKPSTPRRAKAQETALRCGSSSSGLGRTSTTRVGMTAPRVQGGRAHPVYRPEESCLRGVEDGVQVADGLATAETVDLEQHRDADDVAAEALDEFPSGGEGAAGGQHTIDEQHPGTG